MEQLKAVFLGQLDQVALFAVGGSDDVLGPALAHFLLEQLGDDEVLAHGLRRRAGFGDDVEAGLFHIDHVQQRRHALGVDVVLDIETGTAALFSGQLVVMQVVERLLDGNGAQRAAADPQHHKGVKPLTHALRHALDVADDLLLVVGQLHPAQPAGAAILLHIMLCGARRVLQAIHLAGIDAVLKADDVAHHVVDVQNDRFMKHLAHLSSSFRNLSGL